VIFSFVIISFNVLGNINARDNHGNTALTLASDEYYPKITEIAAFLEANGGVE
jgi:hypothetical protein